MNDIDAYLEANRDGFTREALTERLIESGHDPAAVQAAWERSDAAAAGSGAHEGERPPERHGILGFVLILGAIAGYLYVGAYGMFGIGYSVFGLHGNSGDDLPFFVIAALYGIGMLLGLAYAIRRIWRAAAERDAAARLGVALVASGALLIGINGLCVAGNVAYMALR